MKILKCKGFVLSGGRLVWNKQIQFILPPPPTPNTSNLNHFLVAQGMFSLSICMTQSLGADESVLQLWTDLYIILNNGQFCS